MLTEMLAARALNENKEAVIWIATPVMVGTGDRPWRALTRIFDPRGPFGVYNPKIDNQSHIIRMGLITIRLRPTIGRDTGTLEGDEIHYLILDEARLTPREAWLSLYPAVTRVNGQVFIATTPPDDWEECVGGWVRELWDDGMAGKDGIAAVRWRTFDSPVYGGYILPSVPPVKVIADMTSQEYQDFLGEQYRYFEKIDDIYADCMKDDEKKECLYIVAKSEEPDKCREAIADMIRKRMATITVDIEKLLRSGKEELASARFDGIWLARPLSVGEDMLNYIRAGIREGEGFAITNKGELVPGGRTLEIWEHEQPSRTYVIGVDVASGNGGDDSVIAVFKRPTEKAEPARCVAMFRSNIIPADELGLRVFRLARKYNDALIVIERTGGWGVTSIVAMREEAGRSVEGVWILTDNDRDAELVRGTGQSIEHLGWSTTIPSKGQMLTTLRRMLNDRTALIPSKSFYDEVVRFNWDIKNGEHDDSIIACALALQGMQNCPIEKMEVPLTWDEKYDAMLRAKMHKATSDEEEALMAVNNGWLGTEGDW